MSSDANAGRDLALRARRATGLGQTAFARLLGLHNTTVWAWEHGHRNPARRMRSLLLLVEAFPDLCISVLCLDQDEGVPTSCTQDPTDISPDRVLKRLKLLARESKGRVPLDVLRAALSRVSRDALDRALYELEELGQITLCSPLFPDCLNEVERASLLHDPARGDLLFADVLEAGPQSAKDPAPAKRVSDPQSGSRIRNEDR